MENLHPKPGDILSYLEMCQIEEVNLQRGMNFHLKAAYSVILMSLRPNSPYSDSILEDGKILIYEGHDVSKTKEIGDPKAYDQPMVSNNGKLTQNGLFHASAQSFKAGEKVPERVKVYEKLRNGIWVYNGIFYLTDSWVESAGSRKVFKFRLESISNQEPEYTQTPNIEHTRMIPSSVKAEVWKRDSGRCVICGSTKNLHFDHIIPFSKGGSSLVASNIQLLCAQHNLAKRDRIE